MIKIILSILVIAYGINWIFSYFSEYSWTNRLIERLWKRMFDLDNEVYKLLEEYPNFDADNLAYGNSDSDLYYKLWKLNDTIDTTGKLINALLDYYFHYAEEYKKQHEYKQQPYNNDGTLKSYTLFTFQGTRGGFLSIQEAFKIREKEITRKRVKRGIGTEKTNSICCSDK